eukprot:736257-Rhodomonas_salina.3
MGISDGSVELDVAFAVVEILDVCRRNLDAAWQNPSDRPASRFPSTLLFPSCPPPFPFSCIPPSSPTTRLATME